MNHKIRCLPILAGPLRGSYWAPAAGGKIARIFLGTYEREQTELLKQSLGPNSVLLDVGANNGYYSLLASRLSGGTARVFAFEPSIACLKFLKHHLRVNRLQQVTLLEAAAGRVAGTAWFEDGSGTGTGHLADQGTHEVRVVTLDATVAEHNIVPTHVKIDVEGAELDVLQGAVNILQTYQPEIYLSTHGARIHAECCQFLRELGYLLQPIRGDQLEATPEIYCTPSSSIRQQAA